MPDKPKSVPYTEFEDEMICRFYGKKNTKAIGEKLGKTRREIHHRVETLRILGKLKGINNGT